LQVCLLGNHDQGALFDPEALIRGPSGDLLDAESIENGGGTAPSDSDAGTSWANCRETTRKRSSCSSTAPPGTPERVCLPRRHYNRRKLEKIFALIQHYAFQGHTHVPGVFTESFQFYSPEEINGEYRLGDEKAMINVGSVGQPRDGKSAACYVRAGRRSSAVP